MQLLPTTLPIKTPLVPQNLDWLCRIAAELAESPYVSAEEAEVAMDAYFAYIDWQNAKQSLPEDNEMVVILAGDKYMIACMRTKDRYPNQRFQYWENGNGHHATIWELSEIDTWGHLPK